MPGRGGKSSSGPWGRLRLPEQDPLQSVGLPSKGDKKLLNDKAQEKYYTKIMERYLSFCTDAGKREDMLKQFEALSLSSPEISNTAGPSRPSAAELQTAANTRALEDVLMALRKLREGIVATKRQDDFAVQAYIFCIRLSILVKRPESYHPAILHLLHNMFPHQNLTSIEMREILGYLVLDTACRRGDLAEAYALQHEWKLTDPKVDAVLRALTHDNYVRFHQIKRDVDSHRAKLMEWAEDDLRMHSLKCFGKTYLSVGLEFLEMTMAMKWDDLKTKDGVGWELGEEGRVTIRRVRAK